MKLNSNIKYNRIICNEIQCIPIPHNPTNGEVIEAVFPEAKISYDVITDCMSVYFRKDDEKLFDKEWWDAPYSESNKAFKEKKDGH